MNTHSDARIITWSEIQFSNMATLFHGKYLVEINISIVVHSDPLEFHVGDTDRTSPTVLVAIEFVLSELVDAAALSSCAFGEDS